MSKVYHPLVKQLLDGERSLSDLPRELRGEGEEALRLRAAVNRAAVTLRATVEERVMAQVRRHARSPGRRGWRWLVGSREVDIRLRVRPWVVAALAAAAVALLIVRPGREPGFPHRPVYVRFVLYAPGAHRVSIAGSFNQWDPDAAPLSSTGTPGVWTTTVALVSGQYQYAFLVDGARWVTDPVAPNVDDGFGRRNSIVAVTGEDGGGRAL